MDTFKWSKLENLSHTLLDGKITPNYSLPPPDINIMEIRKEILQNLQIVITATKKKTIMFGIKLFSNICIPYQI
jgi:hypothetical protein